MKHPNHDELMAMAQDVDTPMQIYNSCSKWVNCETNTALWLICQGNGYAVRIKPKTIMIGDVEVPEPMRVAPERRTVYWLVNIANENVVASQKWDDDQADQRWLKAGICQATEQGAKEMLDALIKQLGGGHE